MSYELSLDKLTEPEAKELILTIDDMNKSSLTYSSFSLVNLLAGTLEVFPLQTYLTAILSVGISFKLVQDNIYYKELIRQKFPGLFY